MRSSAISRGLCLALLATAARAQTVAAGARAVVSSDTLPVYTAMSVSSAVKATLARGDSVTIGLVLFGDDITWCAISKAGETRRLGFASCEFLEQDRSAMAGASAPAESPRPPPKPITIREVPPEIIAIREAPTLPPATLPPPPPAAPALLVREPTPPQPIAVVTAVREPAPPEPQLPPAPVREAAPISVPPPAPPEPAPIAAPITQAALPPVPVQPPPVPPPVRQPPVPPAIAAPIPEPAPPPIPIQRAPVPPPVRQPPPPEPAPAPSPEPIRAQPPAPVSVRESPPITIPTPVREPAPPEPTPAPTPIRESPPAPIPAPEPPPIAAPTPVREPPPPEPAPATTLIREPAPPPPAPIPAREPAPPEAVVPLPAPAPIGQPAPPPQLAAVTIPVVESAPAASQIDFIETSLDDSGLRSSVANYTQTTRLLSFLDKGRLAEIDVAALDQILSEQFQPGAFYTAIGDQIRNNYSLERLPELVAWLRSPVTKKMADLERRALRPESRDELVAFAQGLSKSPPLEARLLLAHRLYESSRTCDLEVEATIALVHTVALAIGPALPKEKRYSATELDRALGAVKSRYRSIMKNARLVHYLFAYQSVTDAELEQYVGFLESETGKWFVGLVDKGFYGATEVISRDLIAEIPRRVKAKRR